MYLHARHLHTVEEGGEAPIPPLQNDSDKHSKRNTSLFSIITSMGYNILIGCFILALLIIYLFHGSGESAITAHPYIRNNVQTFVEVVTPAMKADAVHSPKDSSIMDFPAISLTRKSFRSVVDELLMIGLRDGRALVERLSTNPLQIPAKPEDFFCPETTLLFDYPSVVDSRRADSFRNGSEGSWIFYQHLRKAGGTGFCELARSNMGRAATPPYYCMIDERGSLATPPWNDPAHLLTQLRSKNYRITSNEWDVFYASMLSLDGAVFGATFRHPVDRIYSQYRFEHLEHRDGSSQDAPRNSFIKWYNNNKHWTMGANYYIKTFVGIDDDKKPASGTGDFYWTYHKFNKMPITASSFYQALNVLRQFHLILVTEWLDSSPEILRNVLNWHAAPKKVLPHEAQAQRNSTAMHIPSSQLVPPQDYQVVLAENALDMLFFQCVQRIYLERLHKCG